MRTSLLSIACILALPSAGLAALAQIDSTYTNSFGSGSRPALRDSQGTPLENGDVYQIVLWGNLGLTPADAGWDWGDYTPITGDGSLNSGPAFDTRIGAGATPAGLALFTQSITFDDATDNLPPGTTGSRLGFLFFEQSTASGPSVGVYNEDWTFPSFSISGLPALPMDIDTAYDAGALVWQGDIPFQIPEPSSSLLALIGALFLARRRR